MSLFDVVIKEVCEHFARVHEHWMGSYNASTPADNAVWIEFFAPDKGVSLLLRVTSDGMSVWASEFGTGATTASMDRRFDLEEPDSVEKLLAFLDSWVEARK